MYRIIRKIHLIATLLLATFVMMYFVTGFIMIFEETFKRENKVEKIKEKVDGIGSIDGDSLLGWSRDRYQLRGQYEIRKNEKRTVVDFRHPGTTSSVTVQRESDSVHVEIRKGNVISVMHQYHRLHGYRGGLNYFAWSFVYDLSAISMIVFAVTGFYLWYKTEKKRMAGWMVFLFSTLLTFCTILYLMYN